MIKVVIFDLDGVIVDSLDAHLNFCKEMASRLNVEIENINNTKEFKELFRKNPEKPIGPMKNFLISMGFDEDNAQQAEAHYINDFYNLHGKSIEIFIGIEELLCKLNKLGIKTCIVSGNREENVLRSLSTVKRHFDERSIYAYDGSDQKTFKSRKIKICIDNMLLLPTDVVYIGDQFSDALAAADSNAHFIGVSWGWELTSEDSESLDIANNVNELEGKIMGLEKNISFDIKKLIVEHAQAKYIYHSGQRHTSIRFYLLTFALIFGAYFSLFSTQNLTPLIGVFLGVIGSIISLFFWALDARNEELVDCDEAALKVIQEEICNETGQEKFKIIEASDNKKYSFISYGVLMPCLFYFFIVLSGIISAVSYIAYSATKSSKIVTESSLNTVLLKEGWCFSKLGIDVFVIFFLFWSIGTIMIWLTKKKQAPTNQHTLIKVQD